MPSFRILSSAEQVAEHLRGALAAGTWRGEMPGVAALAADLAINHKTVDAALSILQKEGLLAGQGARRPRKILGAQGKRSSRSLRIGFLLREQDDRREHYLVEALHRLTERGHRTFFARKSQVDLGMKVEKVADYVSRTPADGWVVQSAPREIVEWFAAGRSPCFALFGFFRRLPIAGGGIDKAPAYAEVARRFLSLGHRRIVLLARPQRRLPLPGRPERHFLRTLARAGITVGDYHFPFWNDNRDDFHRCLESLFAASPPTAMLIQEPVLFAAVQRFLAGRGARVPEDVSLVCDDPDRTFAWQLPTVAHLRWEADPWMRRLLGWADLTARGKDDRRHSLVKAEFVDGGTIGPRP